MAVNPATVPTLTPFQQQHVGTTQSGMSGILPFQHRKQTTPLVPETTWYSSPDAPVRTTPNYVIGSHFHLFNGGILSNTVKNRAYY